MEAFVGLDVGGTNIKALAFGRGGELLAEQSAATLDDGTTAWLERARDTLREVSKQLPEVTGIGVAAPGLPARDGRSIQCMPGRLLGIEALDWQQWLKSNAPVPVFNDARSALLGEAWLGAAKGSVNIVMLTLGTGVGGAAMVDGRLLHGHLGRAGHLGHVSLDPMGPLDIANTPGSLEDAIGEHNLARRSGGRYTSTRELVAAFQDGCSEAAEVWLRSVKALAAAIAGFINVLDPEVVLIGGGIADAGEALFQPLQTALEPFEWRPTGARVRLAKAALGRNAGAAGAAYGAMLMRQNSNMA